MVLGIRYLDDVRRIDGKWRIHHRRAVMLWARGKSDQSGSKFRSRWRRQIVGDTGSIAGSEIGRRTANIDAPASTIPRTQSSFSSRRVEPRPHRDRGGALRRPARGVNVPACSGELLGADRMEPAVGQVRRVTAASVLPPSTIGTVPLIGGSSAPPGTT
jgi:hypothetical protein